MSYENAKERKEFIVRLFELRRDKRQF